MVNLMTLMELRLDRMDLLYVCRHERTTESRYLDKNGTFIRKFGELGSAPGQLSWPRDIVALPDGRLVVAGDNYLNYFSHDGTFITRTNSSSARNNMFPLLGTILFGVIDT